MPQPSANRLVGPATLSAYQPTLRDRAQAWVADHLPFGDNYERQDFANRLFQGPLAPANLIPFFAADEAGRQIASGHPVAGGANLLMTLVPVPAVAKGAKAVAQGANQLIRAAAPEAAQVAERAAPQIIAYHGSPHAFDAFDAAKIGTGEGAQAYGHGLYFAENENTAKSYRNALSRTISLDGKPIYSNGQRLGTTGDGVIDAMLIDNGGDIDTAMADARYHLTPLGGGEKRLPEYMRQQLEALRGRVSADDGGHMYQVGISADPEHFINWDAPWEEQSQKVQDALTAAGFTPPAAYLAPKYRTVGGSGIGRELQNPAEVAALSQAGIPGIKYLDQGSRGAGEGTRNYVVFDPAAIDILKRYGITATALGAGGLGAATAAQDGEQSQTPNAATSF